MMFKSLQKVALIRLALRYVRAHERIADALSDLRDLHCGTSTVAVNREEVDDKGLDVSYASDADTYAREIEESRKSASARFNPGQPFGV